MNHLARIGLGGGAEAGHAEMGDFEANDLGISDSEISDPEISDPEISDTQTMLGSIKFLLPCKRAISSHFVGIL